MVSCIVWMYPLRYHFCLHIRNRRSFCRLYKTINHKYVNYMYHERENKNAGLHQFQCNLFWRSLKIAGILTLFKLCKYENCYKRTYNFSQYMFSTLYAFNKNWNYKFFFRQHKTYRCINRFLFIFYVSYCTNERQLLSNKTSLFL